MQQSALAGGGGAAAPKRHSSTALRRGTWEFWAGGDRLSIDAAAVSVTVNEADVALTPTQFKILACLAERAGTVVSIEELIREVWGEWFGSPDHVFVYIHHIRDRLGPCGRLLQTRRTMGYILRGDPPPDGRVSDGRVSNGRVSDGRPLDGTAPTWTHRLGFDLQSRLISVEPEGDFLGWPAADIVGSPFAIEGIDTSVIALLTEKMLEAREAILSGPFVVRGPDGAVIPVDITV